MSRGGGNSGGVSIIWSLLGVGLVVYLLYRFLPTISSAIGNVAGVNSTGPFGQSSGGLLPFSIGKNAAGKTTAAASGDLAALLAAATKAQANAQKKQSAAPSLPSAGQNSQSSSGAGQFVGVNLNLLQDWANAGNTDLSNYFASDQGNPSVSAFDSQGLDNITIPGFDGQPQLLDLSAVAQPFNPPDTSSTGYDNSGGWDAFASDWQMFGDNMGSAGG